MSAPYWSDGTVTLHLGDCLKVLAGMEPASVDAIVTDPPGGISFMGKDWDHNRGGRDRWIAWLAERMAAALRVLKPGGHALVWALPRTAGWTQIALEDAGFEIRDCILHIFGSGYPKSLDVSKAIDKRRDDVDDVDRVRAWLDLRRREAGLSLGEVNEHFGHAGNGGGSASSWMTNPTSRSLPTLDQWDRLRELIGFGPEMDAEVERLNGRKRTAGHERERIAPQRRARPSDSISSSGFGADGWAPWSNEAVTDDAARWHGWGTALKPGQEIWWLVRKPLAGTVAATVLEHGTGALNIAACKVGAETRTNNAGGSSSLQRVSRVESGYRPAVTTSEGASSEVTGRWPSNLVFTHSAACELIGMRKVRNRSGSVSPEVPSLPVDAVYAERQRVAWQSHGDADGLEEVEAWNCTPDCPVAELDRQTGVLANCGGPKRTTHDSGMFGIGQPGAVYRDSGGASRFFPLFKYAAKAGSAERPRGEDGSAHPTVKPLSLMSWLVRLVTPPGGLVLDPFAGSGPTAEACIVAGFNCILIEKDPASCDLIRIRLRKDIQPDIFGGAA